jgi:L-aminopeptidase/D-esterase-like protein
VEVGHVTLVQGASVRTGVTAVLPRGRGDAGRQPCFAGYYSLNGNGEMTGSHWLAETGSLRLPVLITNTHAVGPCHRGVIDWVARERPETAREWLLPVVAETWDGHLNDINGGHVTEDVVVEALESAAAGPVDEGSVGGGTGMICYDLKGGSGTSSRQVDPHVVGVFVQANFGDRRELTIAGVPLGEALADDNPVADELSHPPGAGSVVAIVATDAPLIPHQCAALARRVTLGIARTGTTGSHFSGDLFLAVSTGNAGAFTPGFESFQGRGERLEELRFLPWGRMDRLYEAVVQATEEAVLNALVANEEMRGRRGRRVPALPRERLRSIAWRRDPDQRGGA